MVDRSTVDRTVFDWKPEEASSSSSSSIYATFRSRPELGRFDIQVTKEEWLDFIELTLAGEFLIKQGFFVFSYFEFVFAFGIPNDMHSIYHLYCVSLIFRFHLNLFIQIG